MHSACKMQLSRDSMLLIGTTCLLLLASCFSHTAVALIHGVDSSQLVPQATFASALRQGFTKAVIRGYQEACSVGGRVDPNFLPSYRNARAAGYTNIDTYWYPCTGSGNACKPYSTQISEIGATFNANSMRIGTIWIDLEKDSVCNTWNYGAAGNLREAQKLISAARASGYKFGVYSSPGEWSLIFGSRSVVLAKDLPLWFATFDNDDSSLALKSPFGGWTSAVGKQYTDKSASGYFDLNIWS